MKKKNALYLLLAWLFLVSFFCAANLEVTTRQGINYKVQTLKIPLYLKVWDFYDRHFNYKWLVRRIIKDKNSDADKIIALFNWTAENVKKQPKELPVVDDHVWHIIVRGYGEGDQPSDVFTTLCNYAGFDAFFYRLSNKAKTKRITVSFVKIKDAWYVFDPRARVYFITREGKFASVDEIARSNWQRRGLTDDDFNEIDYHEYLSQVTSIDFESIHGFSRANIQSPIKRFIYAIKKGGFR